MSTRESTRRSYDAVADAYHAAIGGELSGKPLDRGLLGAVVDLAAGGSVLDVGCGPGHVTAWLAARGAAVVGLDLSPAMVATGRRRTGLSFVAADMTALPVRSSSAAAIVCFYAVIHLPPGARDAAYREFGRVLRPGGVALVSFHVRDADAAAGTTVRATEFFGHEVDLEFRYLDPGGESDRLAAAGLVPVARLDRAADPAVEHASDRSYLLVRRPAPEETG